MSREQPVMTRDFGGDAVVAAAQVLHEGVPGGEGPRRVVDGAPCSHQTSLRRPRSTNATVRLLRADPEPAWRFDRPLALAGQAGQMCVGQCGGKRAAGPHLGEADRRPAGG